MGQYLRDITASTRPWQWYKNLVALVGIVFSGLLFEPWAVTRAAATVILLCLLSGGLYILNDVRDIEKDRKHPRKKNRPIASGRIGKTTAALLGILLVTGSIVAGFLVTPLLGVLFVVHALLNTLYTLWLKNIVIVDVVTISIGFVLRAIAGCLAIGVMVSSWLFITTMLLALLLALTKRHAEARALKNRSGRHRTVLKEYTTKILEQYTTATVALLLASYALYTALSPHQWMVTTVPITIYSVYRYLYLAETTNIGEEPGLALKDKSLVASMILWGLVVFMVLYLV